MSITTTLSITCRFCRSIRLTTFVAFRSGEWLAQPCLTCGRTRVDELRAVSRHRIRRPVTAPRQRRPIGSRRRLARKETG
jgi:hypothetical protein